MKDFFSVILLISVCFFLGCVNSRYQNNRNLLKEYAFCKCFEYATKDSQFSKNDLSESIYKEIANYNPAVYQIIDSLATRAAFGIEPSQIADHEGKKAILLNCFSFYKSTELDSVVKKMDDKVLPGWK